MFLRFSPSETVKSLEVTEASGLFFQAPRLMAEISGIEPPRSVLLRSLLRNLIRFAQKMLRVLGQRSDPPAAYKRRARECGLFFLVEISGIEPLTS